MHKKLRPLTNPFKEQKEESNHIINHVINASKLFTSFISSSYNKVIKVFDAIKSLKEILIENKTSLQNEKQSMLFINTITEVTTTLNESRKKKQNANSDVQKSILQPNIINDKVNFTQNVSTKFYNQDEPIDSLVVPQIKLPQQLLQNDKSLLDLTKDDYSLVKYQKGYKKRKIQEKEDKLTRSEKRQIELILVQTPEIAKHFQQLENQIKIDLLGIETQLSNSNVKTQLKNSPSFDKNQLEANYQKMINKPKKIEIVRQKKDLRRLWRQLKTQEQEAEKRFQFYKRQRLMKMKEKWNRQIPNKLNLDSIVPTYEKIAAERRQQRLRIQEEKQKIQEEKRRIEEQYRKIEEENKKKTITQIICLQKKENAEQIQKKVVQVSQQFCSTEKNNDIPKQAPKPFAYTINNQTVKQQTINEKINIANNSDNAQPNQSFQAKMKKLMNLQIERSQIRVQNKQQSSLLPQNNNLDQQRANKNKPLQVPVKSNHLQSNQNEILKNQIVNIENKCQKQKTNPFTESTVNKINPFLSATPLSSKLSMQDLINKNPQFTIFQNVEAVPQMPQAAQPSKAANLFTSGNNTYNIFKANLQLQLSHQLANIPFQQNSNNFIPPQPFPIQQSNLINNQNQSINQNLNHFSQPVQQIYPNPSYNSLNQNHSNLSHMGYQPGMFAADTNHARNLFESKQAIQPSLFAPTTTQSANYKHSHSRGGPSARHLKKSKQVRIA